MANQHIEGKPTLIRSIHHIELERQSLKKTNIVNLLALFNENPSIYLHKRMEKIVEIPTWHVLAEFCGIFRTE